MLFSVGYLPYLLLKNKGQSGFSQKLGFLPREVTSLERPIWIHAVSVGEAAVAAKLAAGLKKRFPSVAVIISTTTKTGNDMIRAIAPGVVSAVFYYPIDISVVVSRVARLINPSLYVMIETELWPNLLAEFRRNKVPVILANGRISDNSLSGYSKIKFFTERILSQIDCFCMQTEEDARRIRRLGALTQKVFVTGSIKFDEKALTNEPGFFSRQYLGLFEESDVIIAGSTHYPEEKIIIDVCFPMPGPRKRLIIAPRHIERINEIRRYIERKKISYCLFSDILNGRKPDNWDILLVDTIGHLKDLYSAASVVFIGGSLAKRGGQNPIEAARHGKAVVFGPHMFNFRVMAEEFLKNGAAVQVKNEFELKETFEDLLSNPDKRGKISLNAARVIEKNSGALGRTVEKIEDFFPPCHCESPTPCFEKRSSVGEAISTDNYIKFRLHILSIMRDKHWGFCAGIVKGILRVLSCFYVLAVRFVDWSYKKGFRRVYKIDVPVISVGNITVGGTGKTPFTIFLADYFLAKGKKPAVLVRGYGNDENRMLKDELPEVSIYTGQDRVKNAFRAVRQNRDIIILDDAFQHRRIARDLNIVLLGDNRDLNPGYCLPRGTLREPLRALERADILVLTKVDRISAEEKEDLIRQIKKIAPLKPIVAMKHTARFLTDATGAAHSMESFRGKQIFLVSAIADPDYFSFLMEKSGAVIKRRLDFPDHYFFKQRDIGTVYKQCEEQNIEAIVVTAKDYVKIKDLNISAIEEKLFVLRIIIDVVDGKEFLFHGLNRVISG
ncbi:MAG: tetraacyldisaccharide 4'-kinase [Candidatus Omnitrophota bacterium]